MSAEQRFSNELAIAGFVVGVLVGFALAATVLLYLLHSETAQVVYTSSPSPSWVIA